VEPFPDIASLTPEELDTLIASLEAEEDAVSYRRRLLHGRIDLLRKEHEQRVKAHVDGGDPLPTLEPSDLERPLFEGTGDIPPEHELEPLPELGSLTDDELRATIHALEVEEDDVSLNRRNIQGRLDMLRAARAGTLDLTELSKVLASGGPKGGDQA
jgi:hypothetical protein